MAPRKHPTPILSVPDKPKRGRPSYPESVIDKALLALAFHGQTRAAYRELKLGGMDPLPAESTLRQWRHQYSGRIAQLVETHGAEIERHRVAGYMDIISKSQEAVTEAIDKTNSAIEMVQVIKEDGKAAITGDARMITALSGAARSLATVYGITQDKVNVIHGKPTTIIGKEKDAEESLRTLANRFGHTVDSTVEPPKELE